MLAALTHKDMAMNSISRTTARPSAVSPAAQRPEAAQPVQPERPASSGDVMEPPRPDYETRLSGDIALTDEGLEATAEAAIATGSTTTTHTLGSLSGQTTVTGPSAEGAGSATITGSTATVSGSATASTGSLSTEGQSQDGSLTYSTHVEGPSIEVAMEAEAEWTEWTEIQAEVKIDIDATLVEANGRVTKTIEFEVGGEQFEVTLDLEAMGRIGAEGTLTLDITIGADGVKVSPELEGFVGAQAEMTGSIGITHEGDALFNSTVSIGATVGGAATAGGVEARYEWTDENIINFDASYTAPGGSMSASIDGSVDVDEAYDVVEQLLGNYLPG
ncbi:MAG: hypothetical protein MUC96_11465 [Myxococcaceae bacterium]|nr:hypothetical protein [Myxococcaceae bacterium]